jgi:hypothetical protein
MKDPLPIYSGERSTLFWKRIHSLKNDIRKGMMYDFGCALQNLEGRVLRLLKEAEMEQEQK